MRCKTHSKLGPGLTVMSNCENCGTSISSGSNRLCTRCSNTLKQCETCRVPVTQSGK